MSLHTNRQDLRHRARTAVRRIQLFLIASLCLGLLLLLLFTPGEGLKGAREGLNLCASIVIPSLFPFLVVCALVVNTGLAQRIGFLFEPVTRKVFKLPGSAAAVLMMGIIGGYPIGAKATAALKKRGALSEEEGNRLLSFCINSSPAFIIGAVGTGMLHSADAGMLLYAAHICASLLLGIVLGFFHRSSGKKTPRQAVKNRPVSESFVYSVTDSAQSMLYICAFVVLFCALTFILNAAGFLGGAAEFLSKVFPALPDSADFFNKAIIGLLEVTNGCAAASSGGGLAALLLISAMLSWSGLSVHFQIMASIGNSGLSARLFILTRILHIIFSVGLTLLFFHFYPVAVPTFAAKTAVPTLAFHSAPASVALLVLCALLLLSLVHI